MAKVIECEAEPMDGKAEPKASAGAKPKRKRGGGPKTEAGKWAVAKNALKHGLLSSGGLMKDEDVYLSVSFGIALEEDLAPEGELERLLAGRIASCAWRLRRVQFLDRDMLFHMSYDRYTGKDTSIADSLMRSGASGIEALGKFNRYEVMIERSMYRAIHELQRLQAARRGEHVPAPVVADVDVIVSGGPERAD